MLDENSRYLFGVASIQYQESSITDITRTYELFG